ncbi:hypothetical protein N7462_001659 [Penicillium macrosclerotiorum]|uniref:uncharacterized protein n=1 Tax=Penicillium macrosclerotiorum TaxID=303699 RepID=UPI0025491906|nr:uncharacterized protein N7462_001659 [Penicillium macrosclerotiorum]KAJ5692236.1 hypothetical protein N7462_001659 [Penicillium macrosclerotiorum]
MYKTNYELYARESIDSRRSPPPDELLAPLATLYPHVAALQPQYDPNSCTFTGYRHTGYWAAAYTTQPLEETHFSPRRASDAISCRFASKLSKLRRFLSREDLNQRRSEATT